ncbi:MAG TPA: acetylornithine transaminase [Acidimicrobiia bacterium]|nr:acetylornithine transaminase [Acidimicrobiia bacterium]
MTDLMQDILARESAAVMQTYTRTPVVFVQGSGSWLTDATGKTYLDFLTGLAVVSVGHANPRVASAVARQMTSLVHVSNLYVTEPMVELAERLDDLSGLDRVFFSNCGATANEAAIKLARRWGQTTKGPECYEIVSLLDSFHGRSLATLAATGQPAKQAAFDPLPIGFHQVPPMEIDKLADAVSATTAAVMVETTQGEGGVVPMTAEYLQAVRALCDEREILLIVDDVQAGIGRTGTWFSWQQLGFSPDIATTAKALANGLPIGACMATESVAGAFRPGDHATTFGGGPVVCAAALAVLDEIDDRDLLTNTRERSDQLVRGLEAVDGVASVRGRGLLLAALLEEPNAGEVAAKALASGLIVNAVRPDAVRFAPPLSVTGDEVEEGLARFGAAMG